MFFYVKYFRSNWISINEKNAVAVLIICSDQFIKYWFPVGDILYPRELILGAVHCRCQDLCLLSIIPFSIGSFGARMVRVLCDVFKASPEPASCADWLPLMSSIASASLEIPPSPYGKLHSLAKI